MSIKLMKEICRFCLEKFTDEDKPLQINELLIHRFTNITQIELRKSSIYSQLTCHECFLKIKSFSQFKNELIENQMKLYRIVEDAEDSLILQGELDEKHDDSQSQCDQLEIEEVEYKKEDSIKEQTEAELTEEFEIEFLEQEVELPNETVEYLANEVDDSSQESHFEIVESESYIIDTINSTVISLSNANQFKRIPLTEEEKLEKRKQRQLNFRKKISICKECGLTMSAAELTRHNQRVHLKIKNYYCDLCSYSCFEKKNLINHMTIHTKQRPFSCQFCDSTFSTSSGLRSHVINIHINDKSHICEYCSKGFKMKSNLVAHIRHSHLKERNFQCSMCDRKFFNRSDKDDHENIHRNERNFHCKICSKSFKTNYQLRSHSKHHNDPKFTCDICSKTFYSKNCFKTHQKTHVGSREFKCNYCDSSYYNNHHLNRHIMSKHMKFKLHCEIMGCNSSFARKETYRSHVLNHHKDIGAANIEVLLEKIRQAKPENNQYKINAK